MWIVSPATNPVPVRTVTYDDHAATASSCVNVPAPDDVFVVVYAVDVADPIASSNCILAVTPVGTVTTAASDVVAA